MNANFFSDENGILSMRRLLAFILGLASVGIAITALILNADWKAIAFSAGIPMLGSILMMFFTSWSDVSQVLSAVKK